MAMDCRTFNLRHSLKHFAGYLRQNALDFLAPHRAQITLINILIPFIVAGQAHHPHDHAYAAKGHA